MDENKVRDWIEDPIATLKYNVIDNKKPLELPEIIERLRAIADEAELRLANPKWPEVSSCKKCGATDVGLTENDAGDEVCDNCHE